LHHQKICDQFHLKRGTPMTLTLLDLLLCYCHQWFHPRKQLPLSWLLSHTALLLSFPVASHSLPFHFGQEEPSYGLVHPHFIHFATCCNSLECSVALGVLN
jgi:hypothetical protein